MPNPFAGWTEDDVAAHNGRMRGVNQPVAPTLPVKVEKSAKKGSKGPNKTETAAYHYLKLCYPGASVRYEAITFHLERYEEDTLNVKSIPAAYTPDYLITLPDGSMICVEVKNAAYKHASYGRSRLAFRQAALEFPQFQFIWLELVKGEWVLN